jgi:transposase InsO family protein
MPWKVTQVMDERRRFIGQYGVGWWSMAELCRAYGISRKTGYKLVRRFEAEGEVGLRDRSRAPRHHPQAVPAAVEAELVAVRQRHPTWGPRKVLAWLRRRGRERGLPAASTVGAIFVRHGLVQRRRRPREASPRPAPVLREADGPNVVWCADYKGWFRVGDGTRCEPLTLSDAYSRYLLKCQAVSGPTFAEAQPVFVRAFREYGLPAVLRTDNGPPFASQAIAGLTQLAVWWIRLGIVPERIAPGQPAQNGRHERMHRTLKAEACHPPRATRRAQQQAFTRFRHEYNVERPHEALGNRTPAEWYRCSPRAFPARLPPLEYPTTYEVRYVKHNGCIKWHGAWYYLTTALHRHPVGVIRTADWRWEDFGMTETQNNCYLCPRSKCYL